MPNRTLTYPPQMANFRPHGAVTAHIQDGAGVIFHAALGSIGDDKTSFRVYVWSEAPTGTLALIPIVSPPNNAPSFAVVGGRLMLCGVQETAPDVRSIVERDVPGFVAPASTLAQFIGQLAERLKDEDAPITQIVADVALRAVRRALGG
jgi:hypothetical protein